MGLSHGGLRQKAFNAYEETINIPLVVSNPVLFPKPADSNALVSLVDLLPTIATMAGTGVDGQAKGRDLSPIIAGRATPENERLQRVGVDLGPLTANSVRGESVQDEIHFTYDDHQAATALQDVPGQPNRIRAVRTADAKFALYFDPDGKKPPEYEMYDLERDPDESQNLVDRSTGEVLSSGDAPLRSELGQRLDRLMAINGTAPS